MNSKRTIAIETCFLFDQMRTRGVARYGREVYQKLVTDPEFIQDNVKVYWLGFKNLEENLKALFLGEIPEKLLQIEFISLGEPLSSSPINNFRLFYTKIKPIILQIKPDLYFAIYFERGLPTKHTKVLVTTHDAIPIRTGKYSSKSGIINFLKGISYRHFWRMQRNAQAVITVSDTAKKEIIEFGDIPENIITRVYSGISNHFGKGLEELGAWQKDLPFNPNQTAYLLYDAGLEENKNIDLLFKNFAEILSLKNDLYLVITGGDFLPEATESNAKIKNISTAEAKNNLAAKAKELAKALNISQNIIVTGRVSEDAVVGLLKKSQAYINFSNYEGFGFGPLQAMKAGAAAIISNNPCFIEVSGIASLVLNPKDIANNAKQILELINSAELKANLIQKGYTHVSQFSWEQSWKESKEVITSLWT